uniref:CAAX prenyl protease 2/Lysostaphin resistance protein A-like domain-containing protein n=2 Tax=Chaetoceros debilis TaxID=122233 RepID=A0A7S3VC96_9STRA|mmetsp:Transcript_4951/g.6957  ORF Transcript_4951/g.6957 Transcript_4951/m.6957 type:complete len:300 (-) Transcript_4951:31-930(-)|eukprot:CAMPEP_0194095342 /NCGR_PEP_ID=MMETSP0149-20130528/56780_1 /TAXON_ID=122233 /ORGANISM="Chaetoceros debilis, Strain MM31A-1" /LENGTH=299 /DNA_ID=CAMNT_0038781283 /DNA_START=489 /DNA_END=1391 /DNA_ORIENTATION=-
MRTYQASTFLLSIAATSLPLVNALSVSPLKVPIAAPRIYEHGHISIVHQRNPPLSNNRSFSTALKSSPHDEEDGVVVSDPEFNGMTTVALVAGQSLFIVIAIAAAQVMNVPNFGLGDGFAINSDSVLSGLKATVPLGVLAFVLDFFEKSYKPLEDVSKATQRSILGLLGGVRKPLVAFGVSLALGAAAGWGEEMLFRGVLQSELAGQFGDIAALISSAIIFGALHAVTPLYAILAGVASLYFGELYLQYHNLAVPIICHGFYDVGALMAAHYTVTGLSEEERISLANWDPPDGGRSENF